MNEISTANKDSYEQLQTNTEYNPYYERLWYPVVGYVTHFSRKKTAETQEGFLVAQSLNSFKYRDIINEDSILSRLYVYQQPVHDTFSTLLLLLVYDCTLCLMLLKSSKSCILSIMKS